jgi:hypothetical protein
MVIIGDIVLKRLKKFVFKSIPVDEAGNSENNVAGFF